MSAPGLSLAPVQRLPTSGARAVEPFVHDGATYLVVPQLAADIEGQPAQMTAGNSDIDTLVYRWQGGAFEEHQRLPSPGGEDAEFFAIGDRRFLAVASLRSGRGPYAMDVDSVVYELVGERFVPHQRIAGNAAKQWHHIGFDGRHFLAFAQGASHDAASAPASAASCLFEWDGDRFAPFQTIESAWGYNWLFFETGGEKFLAYADHVAPSQLLRWDGDRFAPFQRLEGQAGRAFCHVEVGGESWLAFARLHSDSVLLRFDGQRFAEHQSLAGSGAREFAWLPRGDGGHLVRVNFIRGTREAPEPRLQSQIYAFADGRFTVESEFETCGATDAAPFSADGIEGLAVSSALAESGRFRVDSCIYRIVRDDAATTP